MIAVLITQPEIARQAIQMAGVFTCRGHRHERGSWIVIGPNGQRQILTDYQFKSTYRMASAQSIALVDGRLFKVA